MQTKHKRRSSSLRPVGGWGAVTGMALTLALGLATFTYTVGRDIGQTGAQRPEGNTPEHIPPEVMIPPPPPPTASRDPNHRCHHRPNPAD